MMIPVKNNSNGRIFSIVGMWLIYNQAQIYDVLVYCFVSVQHTCCRMCLLNAKGLIIYIAN